MKPEGSVSFWICCSDSGGCDEFQLQGYNVVQSGERRRSGGICRYHLQVRKANQAKDKHEVCRKQNFLLGLLFDTEGGDKFLRNVDWLSPGSMTLYSKNRTILSLKNIVFWDMAPCRYCVKRRFGGTYRLHLQGRKIREGGTSVSRWQQTGHFSPVGATSSVNLTFLDLRTLILFHDEYGY
jgi:hypothetical protein